FDNQAALAGGQALGTYVAANFLTPLAPLLARSVGPGSNTQPLRVRELQPILAEALRRWQTDGVDTSAIGPIRIQIADLSGATLGLANRAQRTISLDVNAAGWGWFVDRTPAEDTEFISAGNKGNSPHIDPLSVVEHEVGHLLGKDHEASGVMQETLSPGERIIAGAAAPITFDWPSTTSKKHSLFSDWLEE